jgi:hypothetical protein
MRSYGCVFAYPRRGSDSIVPKRSMQLDSFPGSHLFKSLRRNENFVRLF